MARSKTGTPPSYPSKSHHGQARLTVTLASGARRCVYLGPFGSVESRREYQRILAALDAHGGRLPLENGDRHGLMLRQIAAQFWRHADGYYRLADGSPSREQDHFRLALTLLLDLYGDTRGIEFGPLAFKGVRQRLMDAKRFLVRRVDEQTDRSCWLPEKRVRIEERLAEWNEKWIPVEILRSRPALARRVINQRMDHIKRFVAWAVSEELLPPSVHEALLRVPGLRRGHQGTRETPKVKPVADDHVIATLPHLAPQVAAMVQLQALMGARPSEICMLRGRNIVDRGRRVWKYVLDPNDIVRDSEPSSRLSNLHKCAHQDGPDGHAKVKILPIGPQSPADPLPLASLPGGLRKRARRGTGT